MRESLMYGSVRGARGNSRPYRDAVLSTQIAAPAQVSNCVGFRMPAARKGCRRFRRPASENLQGRKPRLGAR